MTDCRDKPSCLELHNPESTSTYSVTAAFLLVAITAASLLLYSCNLVNSSSDDRGGVGIIVPGESIDGIKLGDSKEKVVELLGEPTTISWADGFDRSWRGYHYLPPGEKEGSGFMVLFILEEGDALGPVDYLRAGEPYEGQTTEGIRIGSTVSEVIAAHGEPDHFSEVEWVNEFGEETSQSSIVYCIDSKYFSFSGRDGVVGGIVIYPLYPFKDSRGQFTCP